MKIREFISKTELTEKIECAYESLQNCQICPHKCGVNRLENETGFCRSGKKPVISSYMAHFGEEAPLVGSRGSGTIFFANCNLECCFCQNYDISQLGAGNECDEDTLAGMMISLQQNGCHNINFVTPTHFVPQILKALSIALDKGLDIPIVYNCGGYESLETLKLLENVVDIYMPDAKYGDSQSAWEYSKIRDYFRVLKAGLREMHRQVGDLTLDDNGIAIQGLLIRHLVMPNSVADSETVLKYIAEEISKDTYINIMMQYHPVYKAGDFQNIDRRVTISEYDEVVQTALELGLHRGF